MRRDDQLLKMPGVFSLLAYQMPFYNRALKAQGTYLLETCVDFTVKENYDSGGCSSSSQEFPLEQLYISEMSPGLVTAMQRSVLPGEQCQGAKGRCRGG